MNLSMKHISTFMKQLESVTFERYGYLTPSILSQKTGINQTLAKIILELACKSNHCRVVYLVRSPYGNKSKTFGPYKFKSEILYKPFDPQSFDEDDFVVTPDLIERVYKLL